MTYQIWTFRFRQGQQPIQERHVEILDRGNEDENRAAVEELALKWMADQRAKDYQERKMLSLGPLCVATERIPIPSPDSAVKPIKVA